MRKADILEQIEEFSFDCLICEAIKIYLSHKDIISKKEFDTAYQKGMNDYYEDEKLNG